MQNKSEISLLVKIAAITMCPPCPQEMAGACGFKKKKKKTLPNKR